MSTLDRMIVLEGADGMGKSTLSRELADYFAVSTHPSRGPNRSAGDLLVSVVKDVTAEPGIMDRYNLISDWVYKTVIGEREPFTDFASIKDAVSVANPIIVYCRVADLTKIRVDSSFKVHKPKEYLDKVIARRGALVNLYDEVMPKLAEVTDVVRYDWTTTSVQDVIDQILAIMSEDERTYAESAKSKKPEKKHRLFHGLNLEALTVMLGLYAFWVAVIHLAR